jgi:ABC-2 type transport system ATP-binding protein
MLIVDHLRKEFKNVVAVNDISFVIHPGRIFGLLGPNGAGKTTTIRCLLNIIKPTSGRISFQNRPVSGNFFSMLGYLPEERGLYKKSRVADVIRYMAQLKGLSARDTESGMNIWLNRLNLTNVKNRRIEELSKGNQQKVQFITAVLHNPEIIVLDEPFTGFDPINQQIIRENILRFSKEGKIIILSTHHMETAEKLCHEILLINKGKEVIKGELASVKKKFGGNFIKLGFSGDAEFLRRNKSVIHAEYYNGYAEIQLDENVNPSGFLREVAASTEILNFSIIEPTLNKIFIDSVKESSN